ncbi:MAG TPA: alpha/beta hydrolase [candidate division Zixibacteria bacterium]|nr:alpha/beta hydrolase [candidate division Zixibacteria bacterium]
MAPRGLLLAALAAGALVSAGCAPTLTLPDGSAARSWGDGPYGVVVVPDAGRDPGSWEAVATEWADEGMSVLAVAERTPEAVVAGVAYLRGQGVERVALVGAGAGAEAVMEVGRTRPELVDQMIVLSATGSASELGPFPKLFVASEGEPAATDAERMAEEAPGDWNALYLAGGDASGQELLEGDGAAETLEAIRQRLEERR